MRLRGCLFEARGAYGVRIDTTFDVAWTQADIDAVFPSEQATEKTLQRLWAAAGYRDGATRGLAGLNEVYAAVLDGDCFDVGTLDAVVAACKASGIAGFVYTSWSHMSATKTHDDTGLMGPFDSFRLVLPFTRPVTPQEYQAVVPAIFGHELPDHDPRYAAEVRGKWIERANGTQRAAKPRGWDPASSRPAQAYFAPAAHSEIEVWGGRPVDVEAVLARPTTAKPSLMRAHRQRVQPTREALGALEDFTVALQRAGKGWIGDASMDGWHRSECPACHEGRTQSSPSMRARANGDHIDVHCFVGCKRSTILVALGLDQDGRMAPVSTLRADFDAQLDAQDIGERITVDEAVPRLVEDLRLALERRTPTILKYPAGTGKSHAAAKVIAERVRDGRQVVYATQEHKVARETREHLRAHGMYERSVHLHSPLVVVEGAPTCQRQPELLRNVFEFGQSLLRDHCPGCQHAQTCPAKRAYSQRAERLAQADIIFTSHAGLRQVIGTEANGSAKGGHYELIVDEMPSVFDQVAVSVSELELLAEGGIKLHFLDSGQANLIAWYCQALVEGGDPESFRRALAEHKSLAIRRGSRPQLSDEPALQAAKKLLKIIKHGAAGGVVFGLEDPKVEGVSSLVPDACHDALISNRGVLLSATPLTPALPRFALREVSVSDGARVRRVMYLAGGRGSWALAKGAEFPWDLIEDALERAYREAQRYPVKRALFVTFKAVADALREHPTWGHLHWLRIAHYGATRGKNDWMEGRPDEVSVVYCFGTPRGDILPTLNQLGLVGEAATQAWRMYAAGELTQAEGRLRLPRRKTPCSVLVEGDVAPSSWTHDLVDEVIELV